MKYLKTVILFILLIFLFFLMSCQEQSPEPVTPADLLTGQSESGKTWRIILIEVELGSINPFECVSDNPITYFPNGRYEVNEGYKKCNPKDPPSYLGDWRFGLGRNQILVSLGDSTRLWNIVELDHNIQRISSRFPDGERTYVLKPL